MITIQGLQLLDYHLTVDATTTRCDYHSIFSGTLVIIIQYLHFLDYHSTVNASTTRCDYHPVFAGTLTVS